MTTLYKLANYFRKVDMIKNKFTINLLYKMKKKMSVLIIISVHVKI